MTTPPHTPELLALVVHLRATTQTHIHQHMGRAAQFLFFQIVGEMLANDLHPSDDKPQQDHLPYTVSGLLRPITHGAILPLFGDVNPGDKAWLRFTGLRADVALALQTWALETQAQIARGERVLITFNRIPWEVASVAFEKDLHSWAGHTRYETLIDRYRHVQPPQQLTLHFTSATTFRSLGTNMPLPVPSLVFGSLLSRWCAFTALRLRELPQDQVDAFIQYHLLLMRHDIESALYRLKNGSMEVGFVGTTRFDIAKKNDHLARKQAELEMLLQEEYLWMARVMVLLADFAFYSGVGRKTTTGMGMARLV